ncbi:MAG: MBL fold metallo-hydrolase [Kiritimatiellae bacterium]|nr:MBL fold metallo-hydrolase [Kiritimatiellia bacterium]
MDRDSRSRALYGLSCPSGYSQASEKKKVYPNRGKNDVRFETGPNVVLLSDSLVQNESFSNLSEFLVLQMLYLQGMVLPNHPNNQGLRPILVGIEEQLQAQLDYICRGNYGLVFEKEMMMAGMSAEEAQEMMRIKLKFAFGTIRSSEDLLDTRILKEDPVEILNGAFIQRKGINNYELEYKGERVSIDLGLKPEDQYEIPYRLDHHRIKREYFSIVHSGEGDGWDITQPCMASIILFQDRIYLIDAGPNMLTILNYLGISPSEIHGIFHTHVHDDHFAGLPSLATAHHRLKYYATPPVRMSMMKKLSALTQIEEDYFYKILDVEDLTLDQWANIDGLEAKPVYSPHPVEDNMFLFRTKCDDSYKTYAHFADLTSLDVFEKMITKDKTEPGTTQKRFDAVKETYLISVDLKKVDIGGGLIHGVAEDFRKDTSEKILLAHTANSLTDEQKEIGDSATFGMVDVLIPAKDDYNYLLTAALRYLTAYFPTEPRYEINYLMNSSH